MMNAFFYFFFVPGFGLVIMPLVVDSTLNSFYRYVYSMLYKGIESSKVITETGLTTYYKSAMA